MFLWTGPIVDAVQAEAVQIGSLISALSIDPAFVLELSELLRAVIAFVVVLGIGGLVLHRRERFVNRSIDATMDRPMKGVIYGVAMHGGVVMILGYSYAQLVQFVTIGSFTVSILLGVTAAAWLLLSGVGFTVLGISLVELMSHRQIAPGVVLGAAISALVATIPSIVAAGVVWILLVSIGIGGPTREWVHASPEEITNRS
ncbi:MAG: hypothetical protein ACQETB_11765 [Halobacteriota archaeon]